MRKQRLLLVSLLGAIILCTGSRAAAAPDTERRILVPFDQLHILLGSGADRVLLKRDTYEKLLKEAGADKPPPAPRSVIAAAADYSIAVEGKQGIIRGTLELDVLENGLQTVDLSFSGVGLRRAQLDGHPAALAQTAKGPFRLFVRGKGRHRLTFNAVTPLQTTTARQTLTFRLPVPPATRMTLTVPGDVELRGGAPVAARTYDAKTDNTRFELLPRQGVRTLVMTLNNRRRRQRRMVLTRSVIVDELTEAYERLHANISCSVLHRPLKQFRFRVPAGFEVTGVSAPNLAGWELVESGKGRVLTASLREQVAGKVVFAISALRTRPDLSDWTMPGVELLDAAGSSAVVGLLLGDRLDVMDSQAEALIPISNRILARALPPTVQEKPLNQAHLRPVLAHYAPGGDFRLAATFRKPTPQLQTTANVLLIVERNGLRVTGGFAVHAEHEKQFDLDVHVPTGWRVTDVSAQDGSSLPFERYPGARGASRVRIRLPEGLEPGRGRTVLFEAEHVPPGWFDDWSERQIFFPTFRVRNATSERGAVAVVSRDDLRILPAILKRLTPLRDDEKTDYGLQGVRTDMAYRYDTPSYELELKVSPVQPRMTGESISFFRVKADRIVCHFELLYDVSRAEVRRLAFVLPEATPEAIRVSVMEGDLKEYTPEIVDGGRLWQVQLAQGRRGLVRLAVDFEQSVKPDDTGRITLPLPSVRGVAYQSGLVAVEGGAELDVNVASHPRPVDVGELVDARYQPGPRLLGAYAFVGPPPEVALTVTRPPLAGLPAAIVEEARLMTALSAQGRSQSSARYVLRSKALSLGVELPQGARLWSVTLDGKPANPHGEGRRFRLETPGTTGRKRHELHLVYESQTDPFGFLARHELVAPRLFFPEKGAEAGRPLPVVDTQWQLHTPDAFKLVRSHGPMVCVTLQPDRLAIVDLPGILYRIGGRSRFRQGLIAWLVRNPGQSIVLAVVVLIVAVVLLYLREKGRKGWRQLLLGVGQVVCILLILGVVAGLLLPALNQAREKARMVSSEGMAAASRPSMAGMTRKRDSQMAPPKPQQVSGADAAEEAQVSKRRKWAVKGLRSLPIELTATGPAAVFHGSAAQPKLRITLWQKERVMALAWAVAVTIFVFGCSLTADPVSTKLRYVAGVLIASILPAVVPGIALWVPVLNAAFYAALLLVPYYVVAPLVLHLFPVLVPRRRRTGRAYHVAGAVLIVFLLPAFCAAGSEPGVPEVKPQRRGVRNEPELEPVDVPADATLIPYHPDDSADPPQWDRLFLPRARFRELQERAHPEPAAVDIAPPAEFAPAGLHLTGTLTNGAYLELDGVMGIDVFVDAPVEMMLPVSGLVLTEVLVDGQPARVRVADAGTRGGGAQRYQQAAALLQQKEMIPSQLVFTITGKGRHRVELTLRIALTRRGGWRVAAARLPVLPASGLDLVVPRRTTDVRLSGVAGRSEYKTRTAGQTISTALSTEGEGELRIEWRPKVAEGQLDHTLTAESAALLEVLENSLQLAWRVNLTFRHGERDFFALNPPAGYRVKTVTGDNVRGWDWSGDGRARRLEVETLTPAEGAEQFLVRFWKEERFSGEETGRQIETPVLGVEGAVRHVGRILVRRSRGLDVRVLDRAGLNRVDADTFPVASQAEAPLGVQDFQSYEFNTVPFRLRLQVRRREPHVSARGRFLVRVAERKRTVEGQIELKIKNRPVYQSEIRLPVDFRLESVTAGSPIEWVVREGDVRDTLAVSFLHGATGSTVLIINGTLATPGRPEEVQLPRFDVLGAARQQGDIVVATDPAFDVRPVALSGIEKVLLQQTYDWLRRDQRALARLALHYGAAGYDGRLLVQARQPAVRCWTLTSVRVTDRAIHESVLLDFTIRIAGIDQVRFRLPKRLAKADIRVPFLQTREVEPVADGENVLVTLQLQHEVMGELRVLVRHDRGLSEDEQIITPPVVLMGETYRRYIALESAGRDEVTASAGEGLERINRQRREWQRVARFVRGGPAYVYLVRSGGGDAALRFSTRRREAVVTAGARIGLAQALVVLAAGGEYSGRQRYRVDNRTEQFLEIELPEGAALWTSRVAGRLVKPVRPQSDSESSIRIPLVKTAPGDLDYEVVLKYGGILPGLDVLGRVTFPLIRTTNLNVEQSQVELRLPKTRRWFAFGGTMREVKREAQLRGTLLDYQTRQAKQLLQTLKFGSEFAQARAYSNVKVLGDAVREKKKQWEQRGQTRGYAEQRRKAETVLAEAEEALREAEARQADKDVQTSAEVMVEAFRQQRNEYARNRIAHKRGNWADYFFSKEAVTSENAVFNPDWLADHDLTGDRPRRGVPEDEVSRKVEQQELQAQPPIRRKPAPGAPPPQLERPPAVEEKQQEQTAIQRASQRRRGGREAALARYREQVARQKTTRSEWTVESWMSDEAMTRADQQEDIREGGEATGAGERGAIEEPSAPREAERPAAPTGLASLDVSLPAPDAQRWTWRRFTTPRGDAVIHARSVTGETVRSVQRLAAVVAAVILLGVLHTAVRRRNVSVNWRRTTETLAIIGAVGLLAGVLPVYAAAALVMGLVARTGLAVRQTP